MPRFRRPVAAFHGISDTFAEHVARRSKNPGTDYVFGRGGRDIVAPADGVVTQAKRSTIVGLWLGIDFDNGWGGDLLHNSQLLVGRGDRVTAGMLVAIGGATGSAANGPHLHFSLRPHHGHHLQNFGNVDPEKKIARSIAAATPIKGDNVTLFCKRKSTDDWFIGGESPGTSANLLRLGDAATAKLFVPRYGKPIVLSDATYDSWAERFLEPVKTIPD